MVPCCAGVLLLTFSGAQVLRRLRWFIGTLFMDMPDAPPVSTAVSHSTLTPFCAEDLLYSARELASKNEDGVSILYFLKTVRTKRGGLRLVLLARRAFFQSG